MGEGSVELRGVNVAFATPSGPLSVLNAISTSIKPGEFVSVIGPSGCGKSTLFNVLAGLLAPGSGEARIDDAPAHPGACGYMPQEDLLFPWRTVEQNVALGLEVMGVRKRSARERAREQLREFGLAGFGSAQPSELSGGMRQRAALARAVLPGRKVLLLDEPFGALDALTRTTMQDWLQKVWQDHGWTIIMITHDVREAVYLSDRILVLSPRPARIVDDIRVSLPRPRSLATLRDTTFTELETELLAQLRTDREGPLT